MIKNRGKNTVVSEKSKKCETFLSQFRGLMFARKPETLIFVFKKPRIVKLHMFFVFFPIDILVLDEKKKVLEIKEHFRPCTWFTSSVKGSYCIECPVGSIDRGRVWVGDVLEF